MAGWPLGAFSYDPSGSERTHGGLVPRSSIAANHFSPGDVAEAHLDDVPAMAEVSVEVDQPNRGRTSPLDAQHP